MTQTVTWEELRALAEFRAEHGCAVSLYLNLDPHDSPTPGDAHTRANSLLDAAGKQAEATRSDLTHDQRVALRSDLDRIRRFIELEFTRNGARGLVVFADSLDKFWRPLPLSAPVPDAVKIDSELFLTPLVPLVGRGDGVLVAVVGRERGEVFLLRDRRLDEVANLSEEQPRRHDQGGWSQANYQRHVDELAHAHLRHVVQELERQTRRRPKAKLVIACTEETRAELGSLLSNGVRAALAGWLQVEAHVGSAGLLEAVEPMLARWDEERQTEVVERWREEAARNGRAAAGWAETLEAASDGRIDVLLYAHGANHRAWRCPACGRLQLEDGKCPLDGTELDERDEGLDLAIHQTLARGGTASLVQARRDLEPVGGIGAILRY